MLDKNINNSLQSSQSLITDFVTSSDFNNSLLTAYGDSFDLSLATDLLEAIAMGETALPITMVDSLVINGARGAYAEDTDTIYLASELVSSGDTAAITRTLLEEIGHFVDAKINSSDAAGDEGAIFASLILDTELSTQQLELLQAEDDTAIVEIEGEDIEIEQMATIFVNADASGANDGSSWTDAFTSLQSALEIVTSEDQIWVADGTYRPTTGEDREVSFVIPSGVEIYGGFAGGETALEQRDYVNNQTILSGEIGEDTNVDNSLNVINITDTTASTLIDGFVISDGHADSRTSTSLDGDKGGGILGAENASAIIRNSIVRSNFASSSGGGLRTGRNSNVSIINTTFHDNLSDDSGGAVSFDRNTNIPNVLNSLFYNNEAQFGGAIYNSSNELTVTNSTFINNLASEGDSLYLNRQDSNDIEIIANSILWNTSGRNNAQIVRVPSVYDSPIINNSILTTEYEEEDVSENNSTDEPQFIDPENNDFRLQADSPGIDVGNNEAISAETDIIGNPRIFNDIVDIGAYEYGFFISIEDAAVEESTEQVNAEFNVTLLDSAGNPTNQEVTVNYTTVEDTATADEDFTPTSGTLTFSAEETTQTIVVPIASDSTSEDAETFFVELSDLSGNAVISDARAVGTISDSQIAEISIADATVEEGDSGETAIEFTISLNEEYAEDISVDYSIVEDAATAESDYVEIDGTVTFEAGETEQNITVLVRGDDEIEEDETFFMQLSNPSENASLANEQATGTIINDDSEEVATRTITIDDVAVEEGKEGETTMNFTVSLDEVATETVTVNYATVGDTATAEEDFIATEGILTFAPEEQEKTISVLVRGDTNIEEDETFFFELSNPTGNATLENERAVATIQDDDRDDDRAAPLNTTINRFRNKDVPGTYLFAGERESENIRENFADTFEYEGVAFQVAAESEDDLIPLYRFQSTRTPGTYLFAGEAERENIIENFSNEFNEEGLAFYVYSVGADKATEFIRFQNSDRPGTYLFAGPQEAEGIRDNFSSFVEEGVAFEVAI